MHRNSAVLLVGLLALALPARAEIKLSKVFSPHMVLQRGMPAPIWGTANPLEKVVVTFRDRTKETMADDKGMWSVKLDPLTPGGPDVLKIGEKTIEDVLVGDVWVGSGQSNMDMPVLSYVSNDPVLARNAGQSHPKLRLLLKGATDTWQLSTPETNSHMSALLFSFGQDLQSKIEVPVGIMVGAVGGTPSGFWLSERMYRDDAACAEEVKAFAPGYPYEALQKKYLEEKAAYDKAFAEWKPLAEAAKKEGQEVPKPPRAPISVGRAGETNFGKVGQLFEAFIRPYVGYAIKGVLWDQGESKTNIVGVGQVTLMGALIRGWRQDWGQGDFPFLYVEKPSGGGCAWDYSQPETAKADAFAPLPATLPPPPDADYSHVVFTRIMQYPNTHMVTTSDLGSGIHPPNKSGYGARAARVALGTAYGQDIEWLGPVYASHEITDDHITLKFTHTGKGLAFKNGTQLQGFAIAGEDRKFFWAQATIEGGSVVVRSAEVPHPVAVRYAWSGRFPWANLFNQDGLPAQPFRTDDW